ncbi:MAG: SAM-dependent methyltransferase [Lachnospiraceae bacterium]|nr:SAM-dependent methyltransferase [Lachnospiraceae bacterium]
MDKIAQAAKLLEREFGPDWSSIAQQLGTENLRKRVGKELTSLLAFPERGEGGSSTWRGNCSPEVVSAVLKYVLDTKRYYGKDISQFTLLDPMSGSGTSKAVADRYGITSVLYDLNPAPAAGVGSWNALKNDVENSADLIFFHPPYHDIIQYSGNMWGKPHPDDLSRCENYNDFLEKLNFCIRKFYMALRKDGRLAVLVGDIRSKGQFYSIQHDMMRMGEFESFLVKGQFNCVSDGRRYEKPFIPIVTEYMLLLHKKDVFMVPFHYSQNSCFSVAETDLTALTWHHLIRMTFEAAGGRMSLVELYAKLQNHPKAKKNEHFKERIRATIYEHKDQYIACGDGTYRLTYQVA